MNVIEYKRSQIKRSSIASAIPTIPASSDHTDGTWTVNDIYDGEFYLNTEDSKLFIRSEDTILELGLVPSGLSFPVKKKITQSVVEGINPITHNMGIQPESISIKIKDSVAGKVYFYPVNAEIDNADEPNNKVFITFDEAYSDVDIIFYA